MKFNVIRSVSDSPLASREKNGKTEVWLNDRWYLWEDVILIKIEIPWPEFTSLIAIDAKEKSVIWSSTPV